MTYTGFFPEYRNVMWSAPITGWREASPSNPGSAQLRMAGMGAHKSHQRLREPPDVVRLHMRIRSLVAEWSDNSRAARVAAEEPSHAHDLSGVSERVGDGLRLRLLNPLGESLNKRVHDRMLGSA